jgi:hypothetical protein
VAQARAVEGKEREAGAMRRCEARWGAGAGTCDGDGG